MKGREKGERVCDVDNRGRDGRRVGGREGRTSLRPKTMRRTFFPLAASFSRALSWKDISERMSSCTRKGGREGGRGGVCEDALLVTLSLLSFRPSPPPSLPPSLPTYLDVLL